LAGLVSRFEQRTQIRANLDVTPGWPTAQAPSASLNLYRIVEEALANVRLHSGAQSVRIVLDAQSSSELGLIVSDDGDGFDAEPGRPMGLGTIGMKERAMILGGRLWIEGDAGHGTRVRLVFPKTHLTRVSDSSQSIPLHAPGVPA
jgi:signal transduction histidine kinase